MRRDVAELGRVSRGRSTARPLYRVACPEPPAPRRHEARPRAAPSARGRLRARDQQRAGVVHDRRVLLAASARDDIRICRIECVSVGDPGMQHALVASGQPHHEVIERRQTNSLLRLGRSTGGVHLRNRVVARSDLVRQRVVCHPGGLHIAVCSAATPIPTALLASVPLNRPHAWCAPGRPWEQPARSRTAASGSAGSGANADGVGRVLILTHVYVNIVRADSFKHDAPVRP